MGFYCSVKFINSLSKYSSLFLMRSLGAVYSIYLRKQDDILGGIDLLIWNLTAVIKRSTLKISSVLLQFGLIETFNFETNARIKYPLCIYCWQIEQPYKTWECRVKTFQMSYVYYTYNFPRIKFSNVVMFLEII